MPLWVLLLQLSISSDVYAFLPLLPVDVSKVHQAEVLCFVALLLGTAGTNMYITVEIPPLQAPKHQALDVFLYQLEDNLCLCVFRLPK